MSLSFEPVLLEHEPAASLVAAMRAEVGEMYPGLDLTADHMPKAGPAELGPPGGVFLVGFDESRRPLCGGGVKRLSEQACEIKRMYVVPEGRGRGLGLALLRALEDAARGLGYAIARLDTGPAQPKAERMFRNAGYRPIGNFNDNPVASFFGEKRLN